MKEPHRSTFAAEDDDEDEGDDEAEDDPAADVAGALDDALELVEPAVVDVDVDAGVDAVVAPALFDPCDFDDEHAAAEPTRPATATTAATLRFSVIRPANQGRAFVS
ncbi:hypothetical protein GCM10009839_48900 [Catenulispora yoronensis]|uniref:Uncharacterized protein n=1 Tax=Catenulispora yoronensis TaxID=450799 RepID=A0ABN2UP40_9ACTN